MILGKTFKALHDAHMKQIRGRNARDEYMKLEGHASGLTQTTALKNKNFSY